mgnify:FL=1
MQDIEQLVIDYYLHRNSDFMSPYESIRREIGTKSIGVNYIGVLPTGRLVRYDLYKSRLPNFNPAVLYRMSLTKALKISKEIERLELL